MIQLITPVVFMLFFVTAAGAQSEAKCNPKECNVKCCSPKTCTELVSAGICTPEQVAKCKAETETKVASALKTRNQLSPASCVKSTSLNTCASKTEKSCAPSSSKHVFVEILETIGIKPVTKD